MAPERLNAIVSQRIDVAPGLMILRLHPDGWQLPAFVPGQYVAIGLPGSAPRVAGADREEPPPAADRLLKRAYSIASSSRAGEYLEIFVTLVRSGSLTPRLFALRPGDRLWLHAKITGMFTLASVPADRHLVLVATGTGLSPYLSMLRSGLPCSGPRRIAVLLGARHSWDLGYHAEMSEWQRSCSSLVYLPIISRPTEELVPWPGLVGRVQSLWLDGHVDRVWGAHPSPADSHIFLCGNPAMVAEMLTILAREGFSEHGRGRTGAVHVERYW